MSIAVAKALLAADLDDLDSIMLHVRREFVAWANSPENNRAPGQTSMDGCYQLELGKHWFSSGDPYSKGCGAAMRSAPIGLVFFQDLPRLVEVARAIAICTHAHPTALASSIAAAAAVAYVLREGPTAGMVSHLLGLLNQDRGVPGFIERSQPRPVAGTNASSQQHGDRADGRTPTGIRPDWWRLGRRGGGRRALYCFLRTPNDYSATVLTAANASMSDTAGRGKGRCDSDTIGCIAGGLSGVTTGFVPSLANGPRLSKTTAYC